MKSIDKTVRALFVIILAAVLVLSLLGIFLMRDTDTVLQGQIECEEYNVSGLLPGRIEHIYVREGDYVEKGDTLVEIISRAVSAEYDSQKQLRDAALYQSDKIDSGSRKELISIAESIWLGAKADLNTAKNTYERIDALYKDSIVSLQRKEEFEALYQSALAAERASYYQYQLAKDGAQKEDRASAKAVAMAAQSNAKVVEALLDDSMLTAPVSGEVSVIALNPGEQTSIGTNIMSIVDIENTYLVVNVREDLLINFKMGEQILCDIPALKLKDAAFVINYISPLGSFATWKATKESGGYDLRSFEIHARPLMDIKDLRPGMSALISIKK